jgi:hypothetical protein
MKLNLLVRKEALDNFWRMSNWKYLNNFFFKNGFKVVPNSSKFKAYIIG